ncbi:CusA/CzcA family heavy metal efflux RND transporter [Sulfurihydrogenibium sp.]|uniref:efflux RND transporter permease subunit n=1 Tax=Sulfurihydrogenibium sp. TaxID=2053621 RepID=UPI0026094CB2|nr:CusA/CzcA family heavy metal efflux RND transporter [Sulfurihydrogenibium sp.]
MINFILSNRILVLISLIFIVGFGFYSYKTLPVDTFPDPTPIQVNIYTEAPGLSAEEVESLITKKVETVMSGIKDVTGVRSVSIAGLSQVTVFFKDGVDIFFARRLVMEKLNEVESILDQNYKPVLGPNASGLSFVMFYVLDSDKYTLSELKSIERWKVRPLLKSVDGVEDIMEWGPDKAYLIRPDYNKMIAYNLSLNDLIQQLKEGAGVAGGGYGIINGRDLVLRGIGFIKSVDDIKNITVKSADGFYIKVSDIADVEVGEVPGRRGIFSLNGEESQGNIVVKRTFTNTKEVIANVYKKLQDVNKVLPEGVNLKVIYDQAYLIDKAIHTVEKALIEGIVLVTLAMIFYLGNFRTALVVVVSIPITLLIAFVFMKQAGISGNLMSFAGLAIGMGLFADASVVVIENVYRHLHHNLEFSKSKSGKLEVLSLSVKEVFRPVVFAVFVIAMVFIPIFSFESVEGKYYKPLATTIIFALFASLFVAFVFMPVLAYYFIKAEKEEETKIMKFITDKYQQILRFTLKYSKAVIASVVVAFLISIGLLTRIGTEFAPVLDEGALLVKTYLDPNITREESKNVASFVEKTAKSFPEVKDAFTLIGRAEKSDPEDINYMETFITLKPYNEWKTFKEKSQLEDALRKKLEELPGAKFSFTQPIQMRIDELLSGVKSTVAIKVFGDDLEVLNEIGNQIESVVKKTPGSIDVEMEVSKGKLQLKIFPKRDQLAKFNLTVEQLLKIIEEAIAGIEVNNLREGLISYPIIMKIPDKDINDIERFLNIPILSTENKIVTLSQVVDIEISEGFFKIRHENGQRYALVQANLKGRDLGSFINELRQNINSSVKLPEGYYIQFAGQFENQERAMKKLSIVIPIVIFLIFIILYINYNSVKDSLIVMLNVPFAVIGGIVALYISGFNLSVPAAIGFIAVFGIATLNGVVLISYIRQMLEEGKGIDKAIEIATKLRLRPILITATAASLGLVPILITSDVGSETQKPIATVVIGGIFTSTMLTLLILPAVYKLFYREPSPYQTYKRPNRFQRKYQNLKSSLRKGYFRIKEKFGKQ